MLRNGKGFQKASSLVPQLLCLILTPRLLKFLLRSLRYRFFLLKYYSYYFVKDQAELDGVYSSGLAFAGGPVEPADEGSEEVPVPVDPIPVSPEEVSVPVDPTPVSPEEVPVPVDPTPVSPGLQEPLLPAHVGLGPGLPQPRDPKPVGFYTSPPGPSLLPAPASPGPGLPQPRDLEPFGLFNSPPGTSLIPGPFKTPPRVSELQLEESLSPTDTNEDFGGKEASEPKESPPNKQARDEFCNCSSKCLRKPYCKCKKRCAVCSQACHPKNTKCLNK